MNQNPKTDLYTSYAVTQSGYPLDDPNKAGYDLTISRQFYNGLDLAVKKFVERINDHLDTGCVQLWAWNENNQTWSEIGSLYL